ncbi:MAG: type III PLP-dependent enzyme [Planctomycetota bacterium]|jgi:diaminopimelate decarboxylase
MSHASALLREHFGIAGGELAVGGVPVSRLAQRFETPLFVYDAAVLRSRLDALRAALPARVEVYYSVKANPNPAVVAVFVAAGTGLEVASGAEFLRARSAGCPAERIVFAGPGKTVRELELVVREGIGEIHLESDEELAALVDLKAEASVSVRFNPGAEASGGAMRMGGKPAQFGFDEERLAEVIAAVRAHRHLRFSGVHMFAGTQILDADVLLGQWRHAVEVARRAADVAGGPVATVDLGGGLGIPYFPHESALDLEAVRAAAAELFATIEGDPALLGTRFILEPGRFLAGPAGVYLCRVLSVKESRGTTFLVLDGGMNHHLAASGNLGQVIKRDYPILNASRPDAGPLAEAVVVGPLCTPLDTLGRKVGMPRTTTSGDLVAILQSGAYGLSASPVGFLSHPMPAEVLVEQGAPRLIRGRGSFLHPIVPLP